MFPAAAKRLTAFFVFTRRQLMLARQNIFLTEHGKTPSMGWMFVPLMPYHGGGAEAILEPLSGTRSPDRLPQQYTG
ncbi:hypothetical protein VQ056_18200 [Paenibacillus sp. JTLBN-2024]